MLSPLGGTMEMEAIMSRPVRMDRETMIREHLQKAGLGKKKGRAKTKARRHGPSKGKEC